MNTEDQREFIKKSKLLYKDIKYIECPAFSYEKVFFNKYGFNHLIRKNRKLRDKNEQIRRLTLLPQTKYILSTSNKFATFYSSVKDIRIEDKVKFWSFTRKVNLNKITVIVRQIGSGNKHFFSVF